MWGGLCSMLPTRRRACLTRSLLPPLPLMLRCHLPRRGIEGSHRLAAPAKARQQLAGPRLHRHHVAAILLRRANSLQSRRRCRPQQRYKAPGNALPRGRAASQPAHCRPLHRQSSPTGQASFLLTTIAWVARAPRVRATLSGGWSTRWSCSWDAAWVRATLEPPVPPRLSLWQEPQPTLHLPRHLLVHGSQTLSSPDAFLPTPVRPEIERTAGLCSSPHCDSGRPPQLRLPLLRRTAPKAAGAAMSLAMTVACRRCSTLPGRQPHRRRLAGSPPQWSGRPAAPTYSRKLRLLIPHRARDFRPGCCAGHRHETSGL